MPKVHQEEALALTAWGGDRQHPPSIPLAFPIFSPPREKGGDVSRRWHCRALNTQQLVPRQLN